jgi:hypothetical protein
MSRISEALRRAAEQYAAQAHRTVGVPAAVEGQELAALSHESFPVEMGEWRRTHAHGPADRATAEAPAAPATPPARNGGASPGAIGFE